jgi:hypothetical protein
LLIRSPAGAFLPEFGQVGVYDMAIVDAAIVDAASLDDRVVIGGEADPLVQPGRIDDRDG